jgi:hypothetical protein
MSLFQDALNLAFGSAPRAPPIRIEPSVVSTGRTGLCPHVDAEHVSLSRPAGITLRWRFAEVTIAASVGGRARAGGALSCSSSSDGRGWRESAGSTL